MKEHVRSHVEDQSVRIEREEETKHERFAFLRRIVSFTFASGICFKWLIIRRRRSKNSVNMFLICAIFGCKIVSNF